MPYSGPSDDKLPSNVKKMSAKDRRKWVAVFNSTYSSCVKDGGETDTCETKAFRIANGTLKRERDMSWLDNLLSVFGKPSGSDPEEVFLHRIKEFQAIQKPDEMDEDQWRLVKRTAAEKLTGLLLESSNGDGKEKKRSISLSNLYQMVGAAVRQKVKDELDSDDGYYWDYDLLNIYHDNNSLYALVNNKGRLLRTSVTVMNNGGSVEVGELEQVVESHESVSRNKKSSVVIFRQNDGRYRVLMRAATAVLNRVGEIDSMELFDNMIDHANQTNFYPLIDFYHLGKYSPETFDVGEIDYIARTGVVYIASGILDPAKVIGRKLIQSLENKDHEWGCSIEYYPLRSSKERVGNGSNQVEIEVGRDGINTRIAIVLERDAAAYYTGIVTKERSQMDMTREQLVESLRPLFPDEDELEEFLGSTQMINDDVERKNLVHRSKDGKDKDGERVEDKKDNKDAPIIEIDDQTLEMIVSQVVERIGEKVKPDDEKLDKIFTSLEALSGQMGGLLEAQKQTVSRVKKLEEQNTLLQDLNDDLGQGIEERQRIKVTHRPSQNGQPVDEGPSFSEIAEKNLDIPGRPY